MLSELNRVGDIFPAALRRSSRACNPNLGFGSKSASIPRPLAAGFLIFVVSFGETKELAIANLKDAIQLMLKPIAEYV